MHKVFTHTFLALAGVSALLADGTGPFAVNVGVPEADIWMYVHGSDGGTRDSASVYTSLPSTVYAAWAENRFAQYVLKFKTSDLVQPGLGVNSYHPGRVVMTAVVLIGGVPYDPTPDPYQTSAPGGPPDADAGTPIEVHGTGFRGTATAANFGENSSYGAGTIHGRNAYAMGYTPEGVARDVSQNVTEGFDSIPWAIGKVYHFADSGETGAELNPGETIPYLAQVKFELNLSLPGVDAYVRQSLNAGYIWLTISSLHSTTQESTVGYPTFFTKEHPEQARFGDVAATLQMDYPIPVQILSFNRNVTAGTASISWNASPLFKYELQRSELLTPGSWQTVNTYQPTNTAPLSWSGVSASPKTFFRVSRTLLPPTP